MLRQTKTPLCVIRRPPIGKIYYRFLVPIVDDELGEMACNYAVEVARAFTSTLFFVTVADASATRAASDLLDRAKQCASVGGIKADGVILAQRQSVSQAILDESNAQESDAIIMASHARDGYMRLVKGSVTEAVIRSSLLPVVVIR